MRAKTLEIMGFNENLYIISNFSNFTLSMFPLYNKGPSNISDPLLGRVPVAYDDMEARRNPVLSIGRNESLRRSSRVEKGDTEAKEEGY